MGTRFLSNSIKKILSLFNLIITKKSTVIKKYNHNYKYIIYCDIVQPIFQVPVEITRDFFGFDFFGGYHPYTETMFFLKDLKRVKLFNSKIDSPLNHYYTNFQPKSVYNIFEIDRNTHGESLIEYQLPWDYTAKTKNNQPLPYSGPLSDGKILKELNRNLLVLNSIATKGYQVKDTSNLINNNNILGYFLRRNTEYRFIVVHGKHRISALSVLGEKKIQVSFLINKPRVIDINDIVNWPGIINRKFSIDEATKIFNFFFNNDGLYYKKKYKI